MKARVVLFLALCLLVIVALQAGGQPQQGFGPVYDATNQALRVNTVAGSSGGTSSNFNQAMPGTGTAAGFRTAAGLMASASVTNNNALLVEQYGNVTDTSNNAIRVNLVAGGGSGGTSSNFGTAFPTAGTAIGVRAGNGSMASASVTNTSALLVTLRNTDGSEVPLAQDGTFNTAVGTTGPLVGFRTAGGLHASASITNNNALLVEHYGNVTDTSNNALRVNLVAGGGSGGTSSNFGTAWPTAGTAAGFRDPLGAMASATVDNTGRQIVTFATPVTLNAAQPTVNVRTTSDSTLTATVTQSNASSLNATVAGGASASVVNTWSVNVLSDAGAPVRPGDSDNKALRVNIVAGGITIASNSFVNLAKVNNDTVNVGVGSAGAGTQRVAVASDSQGNAGDNQAIPTRVDYIGGRSGGNALGFIRCDSFASIATSNAGNFRLVAAVSSQSVYVCGYTFVAGISPVGVKFVSGGPVGASPFDPGCGAASTDLTGAMTVAASGGVVNAVSVTPVLKTTVSQGLCINLSNGAAVGGHISYTQF